VPDTGVARHARTTSDSSTQRVMSRGANKQTGAWRLTSGSFRDGLLYLSNFYGLPARARGSLFVLIF